MSGPLAPTPIVAQPRPIRATHRDTGAALMLVPSASVEGKFHLVSADGRCDCRGYQFRNRCSHVGALLSRPLPCVCGNYHLTDADRIKAHPDVNRQSDYGRSLGEPVPAAPRVPLVSRLMA